MTTIHFSDLPASARIWIYGAERQPTAEETRALHDHMAAFMTEWQSHGRPVTPSWQLVHDRFVTIGADEAAFDLSGCSIDTMFRALEQFGRRSGLNFTNSGSVVFYRDAAGGVQSVERFAFADLVRQGVVNGDTIVFNNTIATAGAFQDLWEVPMRMSWHMDAFGGLLP